MSVLCAEDYRSLAQIRLASDVWDFISGGSGAELTVTANSDAYDRATIRPRVLVDVSRPTMATTLLGGALETPVGIAPIAFHQLVHPDGELATARGAGETGALFVVSMLASESLEDIAKSAAGAPLWLQLYFLRRRSVLAELATRAQAAGYQALVLTIDVPLMGRRLRDLRNGFVLPPHVRAVNVDADLMASAHEPAPGGSSVAIHTAKTFDPGITWSDIAWLKATTDLPLVLKGILTAEDAARAVDHGADGIIVSNHGGRQVDGAIPALHALPEVVAAVNGACPVLVDGGIRRGRDAFIALALGASAVLVGRAAMWGLAVDGATGVSGVIRLISEDLAHTMVLAGTPTLADIRPERVRSR